MRRFFGFFAVTAAFFLVSFFTGFGRNQVAQPGMAQASADDNPAGDQPLTLPADVRRRLAGVSPTSHDFRPAVTFWEVLGKVKTRYVDRITDQDKLTHGAVSSMLRSLRDPYSRVMTPEEVALDHEQALGIYHGVGAILGARLSGEQVPVQTSPSVLPHGPERRQPDSPDRVWQLVVVDTVPGGAAARAGLQTGDVISKINGDRIDRAPLATKTIDDLNLLLNGRGVHTASLSVLRPSTNATLDFNMTGGGDAAEPSVEARTLSNGAVYTRIHQFSSGTASEFSQALARLASPHASTLVLDLRDNPGGMLSAAQSVVAALAPAGAVGLLDTHGASSPIGETPRVKTYSFAQLVVLVDPGTANVAEMVAGALRERRGAMLAGAPTFGNGLVQSAFPLKDGWMYSLTTGRLRTPRGADFNQHGLAVDRPISASVLGGDAAISAAVPSLVALHPSH